MVETATKERTERATAEQTFQRAEDTMGTIFDNNRRTLMSLVEYSRRSVRASYEIGRSLQDEMYRQMDSMLDAGTKWQKTWVTSARNLSNNWQEVTEQTVKEMNERMEDNIERTIDLMAVGAPPSTTTSRRR